MNYRFTSVDHLTVSRSALEKVRLLFAADMNNIIPKHSVCIILDLSSILILSDDRVSWSAQYSSYKRNQNGKVGGFDLFIFRQSENPKIKSPEKYIV